MIFYQLKELHKIIIKIMSVFLIEINYFLHSPLNARVMCYLSFELYQRQISHAAHNTIFSTEDKQTMKKEKSEMNVLLSDL